VSVQARELPTITLVTPSFNQARFLERTLRSVLGQGYPRLQYVVMDGGSTDGSVELIRAHERQLHHWQSGKDGGQGAAIIEGWRRGDGQLIGWLNSDDVLLDGALDTVGRAFSDRHQVYYGDDISIGADDEVLRYRVNASAPDWFHRNGLLLCGQPGTFFTRSWVEEAGFFDPSLVCAMEYDLMLRLFSRGARARLIPSPVAALRHHDATKTNTLLVRMLGEQQAVFRRGISGPFGDWRWSRLGRSAFRAASLLRYANPLNARRTFEKLLVAFTRQRVVRYQSAALRPVSSTGRETEAEPA